MGSWAKLSTELPHLHFTNNCDHQGSQQRPPCEGLCCGTNLRCQTKERASIALRRAKGEKNHRPPSMAHTTKGHASSMGCSSALASPLATTTTPMHMCNAGVRLQLRFNHEYYGQRLQWSVSRDIISWLEPSGKCLTSVPGP